MTVPGICKPIIFHDPPSQVKLPSWGVLTAKYFHADDIVSMAFAGMSEQGEINIREAPDQPVTHTWSYLTKALITISVIGLIALAVMLVVYKYINSFVFMPAPEPLLEPTPVVETPSVPAVPVPPTPEPGQLHSHAAAEAEVKIIFAEPPKRVFQRTTLFATAMDRNKIYQLPSLRKQPVAAPTASSRPLLDHPLFRLPQIASQPKPVPVSEAGRSFFRYGIEPCVGNILSFLTQGEFDNFAAATRWNRLFHRVFNYVIDLAEDKQRPYTMRVTYIKEGENIGQKDEKVKLVWIKVTALDFEFGYNLGFNDAQRPISKAQYEAEAKINKHLQQDLHAIEKQVAKQFPDAEQVFDTINVSNCVASLFGIMYNANADFIKHRNVYRLVMQNTRFTSHGLSHWYHANRIHTLIIDGCNLTRLNLNELEKVRGEHLRVLRCVNHQNPLNPNAVLRLANAFPKLERLDVTLSSDCYKVTFKDDVTFQLLQEMVTFCEHVTQKDTVNDIRQKSGGRCPTCRASFDRMHEKEINPRIWRCQKSAEGKMTLQVVDVNGKPLAERNWYHIPCGSIYDGTKEALLKQRCNGCNQQLRDDQLVPIRLKRLQEDVSTITLEEMAKKIAFGEPGQRFHKIIKEAKVNQRRALGALEKELDKRGNILQAQPETPFLSDEDRKLLKEALSNLDPQKKKEQSNDAFLENLIDEIAEMDAPAIEAVIKLIHE